MRKEIVAASFLLVLLGASCDKFVPRKDKTQIVKFQNLDIKKENHILKLYKIEYPDTPQEQDKFYEDFEILASKMAIYKKDINMIIPVKMYQDLQNLRKRNVREGEKIYYKPAYSLDESEKQFIDKNINVSYPSDAGPTQKYINKQMAYWYKYINKENLYEKNKYYTELDKAKIVADIMDSRNNTSETSTLVQNDFAIEVDYNNLSAGNQTGLPLYIKTNSVDVEKLKALTTDVIIVDGNIKEEVIPNKILLIQGKTTKNIKDYPITTEVESVKTPLELISKLELDNDLKLEDIEKFTVQNISPIEASKASVRESEKPRQKMNFISIESKWGIEK